MTKQPIPIWLDCDPGNDDAFAILLSLFDPRFELLGISTVHGNAPLEMTTHNTLSLLDLLHVHNKVKVYRGLEVPLENEPQYALDIHGNNGIGGVEFPEKTTNQIAQDRDYLEALKETIEANAGNICLVCTGTLTNIAKLVAKYPEIKDSLKYVSIMGGSFGFGNVSPYAEFNFHADPHAAKIVLDAVGDKVILAPLNFTHTVIANSHVRRQIYDEDNEKRNSYVRSVFYTIITFYSKVYGASGFTEGPPVHDPLAVYSLLPFVHKNDDYGYKFTRRKIDVIVDGEHAGETVVVGDKSTPKEGVYIGEELNNKKFWDSLLLALKNADLYVSSNL
ncbi:Uridine nucleosidase [Candida viswanathii]|uniref:Uridine nucleosidase n=1 Tax=Candida viswanathii TaxID=5486 RepID=A0A367YM15_9ASCO|nr:Uridine nucleosidase [Candida viswanathii]